MIRAMLGAVLALALSSGVAAAQSAPASDAHGFSIQARYAGPDGGWDFSSFDPVHRRLYVSRSDGVTALDVDSGQVTPKLVPGAGTHIALSPTFCARRIRKASLKRARVKTMPTATTRQ